METYLEEEDLIQLWIRLETTTVDEFLRSHQTMVRDEELKPILWEKQSEALIHFEQLVGEKGYMVKKQIESRWKDIYPRFQIREPHRDFFRAQMYKDIYKLW